MSKGNNGKKFQFNKYRENIANELEKSQGKLKLIEKTYDEYVFWDKLNHEEKKKQLEEIENSWQGIILKVIVEKVGLEDEKKLNDMVLSIVQNENPDPSEIQEMVKERVEYLKKIPPGLYNALNRSPCKVMVRPEALPVFKNSYGTSPIELYPHGALLYDDINQLTVSSVFFAPRISELYSDRPNLYDIILIALYYYKFDIPALLQVADKIQENKGFEGMDIESMPSEILYAILYFDRFRRRRHHWLYDTSHKSIKQIFLANMEAIVLISDIIRGYVVNCRVGFLIRTLFPEHPIPVFAYDLWALEGDDIDDPNRQVIYTGDEDYQQYINPPPEGAKSSEEIEKMAGQRRKKKQHVTGRPMPKFSRDEIQKAVFNLIFEKNQEMPGETSKSAVAQGSNQESSEISTNSVGSRNRPARGDKKVTRTLNALPISFPKRSNNPSEHSHGAPMKYPTQESSSVGLNKKSAVENSCTVPARKGNTHRGNTPLSTIYKKYI